MGKYAFSGCDSLQNVIMKATVTQIDVGTFQSCYNLKTVSLLGDVILIGNNAFSNCRKLESIFLPNSVTRIGNYVFDKCDSLSDIYFMGNENEWNNIIIGNYNDALLNTRIHYNSTEILPPETDVDCIMSTFAALFGDQSININVPNYIYF